MKTVSTFITSLLVLFYLFNPIKSYASTDKVELDYLDINEVDPKPYYSWGDNPTITVLDNGLVLSVSEYKGDLTYTLGEFYEGEIYWTFPVGYDTGKNPSVTTMDNGDVIEIHMGPIFTSLYYNLGRYEDGKINWYSIGNKYDSGRDPNITVLSTGNIVSLQRDSGSYNSSYVVGTYNDGSINWDDQFYRYGNNSHTSGNASLTELNDGRILGSHENNGNLEYIIGNLTNWNSPTIYEWYGRDPVSLQLDNGMILTMFEGTRGESPTWYKTGELNGDEIKWTSSTFTQFNGTDNDVVQLQNGLLLNVHKDPNGPSLRYVLGTWDAEANRVWWWVNGL
ncbi:hypothetical protein [Jeotgalibacillus marinus]|uniref:Uncharacterized protein n=1 Tax=Jeotgalibacillus marinus TaxID=86667 RepID=A0ABV3Q7M4_9BACL